VASWDLTGRRGFGTWAPVPAGAQAAAMSPGGSRLLLGTKTGQVTVLGPDLSTQRRITVTGSVTALAVSPGGRLAAAGTQQGTVTILDLGTGAVTARIGGLHAVGGVAWSPDGRLLAATDQQAHRVRVISTATWRTAAAVSVPSSPGQVAWSADGRLLAIGITGSSVAVADPHTGRLLHRLFVSHDPPVAPSVAFTRGPVLAVGARDGSVRFWDAATGTRSLPQSRAPPAKPSNCRPAVTAGSSQPAGTTGPWCSSTRRTTGGWARPCHRPPGSPKPPYSPWWTPAGPGWWPSTATA
jgi:WD40 repeat protein